MIGYSAEYVQNLEIERDEYKVALEKIRDSDGGYAPALARIALAKFPAVCNCGRAALRIHHELCPRYVR